MKIQIKNLGAIKDATIDLDKKLTVFCGPNGTGKTYMSYAIYAITKFDKVVYSENQKNNLAQALFSGNNVELTPNIDMIWEMRKSLLSISNDVMRESFAIPDSKAKDFFKNTEVDILETKDHFEKKFRELSINEIIKFHDYSFILDKSANTTDFIISKQDVRLPLANEDFYGFIETALMSRINYLVSFYPLTTSVFFPIERNAIYTFSKEISIMKNKFADNVQNIVENKGFEALAASFKRSKRYPQAIKDNLEIAQDLDNIQQRNSEYYDYAKEIEDELLNGKVTISDEGNVEFRTYRSPKMGLAFNQSASIVKTLASLIIYLRHSAEKNDLIIIDEPELNLHPNAQIILTRIFARLINKGLRFVISTHSDYIIRELNNLIMVGADNQDVKEVSTKLGYKEDEFIKSTDVGAYLFDYETPKSKQVKVKPIKVDKNGFEVSTFDKTIEELNKHSDELFYTLKYGKAKE